MQDEATDPRAMRPAKAARQRCGARCRRVEVIRDATHELSPLAICAYMALVARGRSASVGALAHIGDRVAVRGAVLELVNAGVARFAACGAPVAIDLDAAGLVRTRSRCRLHGGTSTGAKTAEGRARLAAAGRAGGVERWRRWRIVNMPSTSHATKTA